MRIGILTPAPLARHLPDGRGSRHQARISSRQPARLGNPARALDCIVGTPEEAAASGEAVAAATPLGVLDGVPHI